MTRTLRAIALATLVVALGATGQTNQQFLTYQDVVDNVTAGNLRWSGSALTGSSQVITASAFAAAVTNNGACPNGGSATTYLPTFGDMFSCRTLASGVTQHTTSVNGAASGNVTCNGACLAGGGSPTVAVPLSVAISVAQVDATHPVAVSATISTSGTDTWTLSDNAGTTQASGSGATVSASVTTGATGTWRFRVNETTPNTSPASPLTATSSGSATSYF